MSGRTPPGAACQAPRRAALGLADRRVRTADRVPEAEMRLFPGGVDAILLLLRGIPRVLLGVAVAAAAAAASQETERHRNQKSLSHSDLIDGGSRPPLSRRPAPDAT